MKLVKDKQQINLILSQHRYDFKEKLVKSKKLDLKHKKMRLSSKVLVFQQLIASSMRQTLRITHQITEIRLIQFVNQYKFLFLLAKYNRTVNKTAKQHKDSVKTRFSDKKYRSFKKQSHSYLNKKINCSSS